MEKFVFDIPITLKITIPITIIRQLNPAALILLSINIILLSINNYNKYNSI